MITNRKLKEIISDMIDTSIEEWQCNRLVDIVRNDEFNFGHDKKRLARMYGMSLYASACKKYNINPTDSAGKSIDDAKMTRWLNRSHRLNDDYHYREELFKPLFYKLIKL
jgi:hypothetical protein